MKTLHALTISACFLPLGAFASLGGISSNGTHVPQAVWNCVDEDGKVAAGIFRTVNGVYLANYTDEEGAKKSVDLDLLARRPGSEGPVTFVAREYEAAYDDQGIGTVGKANERAAEFTLAIDTGLIPGAEGYNARLTVNGDSRDVFCRGK
jgi:hypothetical protein